jgi:hypothetical protein
MWTAFTGRIRLVHTRRTNTEQFALRAEWKKHAIFCSSGSGPVFRDSCICVSDNCNRNTNSSTVHFDITYDSVNGEREADFLTGAQKFTVKEIEVFEIADSTALPANREKCANGCLLQKITRNAGGRVWRLPLRAGLARAAQAGDSAAGKAVSACGG